MVEITESITIDASREKIFSFVSDYRNDVKWRQGVLGMRQVPDGKTAAGTETFETIKFMGRKMEVKAEVTELIPDSKVSFRTVAAPMNISGFRKVESMQKDKTSFTYSLNAELTGFYKFFSSSIEKSYRKRIKGDLFQLKALMENGG